MQAALLLPMNTVQTQMQARGLGTMATLRGNFSHGALGGVRSLYRALAPTVGMLGLRQGLKFGSGAIFKQHMPTHWPEAARDASAGALSALTSTSVLFPLDTLKTRWQLGLPSPRATELYHGFSPAGEPLKPLDPLTP